MIRRAAMLLTLSAVTALCPGQAEALSCAAPVVHYIASCSGGRCESGFVVRYRHTYHGCETIPEVEEIGGVELNAAFTRARTLLDPPRGDGVARFTTTTECDVRDAHARCAAESRYTILSADPADLARTRQAWEEEETSAHRAVLLSRWSGVAILTLLLLAAVGFPLWVRRTRRRVGWMLIPLIAQLPLAAGVFLIIFFAYAEWVFVGRILLVTLLLLEVIELRWLLVARRAARLG